jgi:LCP family protein required for cell wall assembly
VSDKDLPQRRNVNSRGHVTKLLPADQTENANRAPAGRASRVRERIQRRNDDALRFPQVDWTWGVIGAAVVGVLCLVSLVVAMASRQTPAAQPTSVAAAVTFTPGPSATPDYNIRAWDGQARFTILLMGLDKRPSEQGTGFRTDTMILVSIDPKAGQVGLLSLPRDVYVPLPGSSDMQQINRVFILGELERPGYGPRKLADVVQYNLGMPINSYVAISFETFITAIDTIGGVEIDVPTAINDPEYPDMNFGYDPLFIPVGKIRMDGKLALKYARTRHQSDDFDRNQRQQQLILAIRQQALTPEVLAKLAGNAPGLWNSISGGVLTDLNFDQLLGLAWYLKDVPADKLRRGAVDREFILATQLDGNPILTINRTNIATLLTHVFGADYNR